MATYYKTTTVNSIGTSTIYEHTSENPVLMTSRIDIELSAKELNGLEYDNFWFVNYVKADGTSIYLKIASRAYIKTVSLRDPDGYDYSQYSYSLSPDVNNVNNQVQGQSILNAAATRNSGTTYTFNGVLIPTTNNIYNNLLQLVFDRGDKLQVVSQGNTSPEIKATYTISVVDLPKINPYKVSKYQGVFAVGNYYNKNDTVLYQNNLYIAKSYNNDSVPTTSNWQLYKTNATAFNLTTLNELSNSIDQASVNQRSNASLKVNRVLSNKTFSNAKLSLTAPASSGFYFNENNFRVTLPTITSDTQLVTTGATQTLANKTLSGVTIQDTSTVEVTALYNYTTSLSMSDSSLTLFTPVNRTLTSGTNTLSLDSNDGMLLNLQTTTTAGHSFTLTLPSASGYSGFNITVLVRMRAANQTLSFSTVKTARSQSASINATVTDTYTLISDGINWYCIQTNKGLV
jgi:hypothetical protein